mmetsp:Transcript_52588/g.151634  ORF Transcript_52588/g.151634 Transcript_52588/m.151634 type:complete len:203 (+) Transcript_52588:58-666(+)
MAKNLGPKYIKWGRFYDVEGKARVHLIVEYAQDRSSVFVKLAQKPVSFNSETCLRSLHDAWPVWFCIPSSGAGQTLMYLMPKDGTGSDVPRGGLISALPGTGFISWSRLTLNDPEKAPNTFHAVGAVILDSSEKAVIFNYMDSKEEARIFVRRPVAMAGELCMANMGPLMPLLFCTDQMATRMSIYARTAAGERGSQLCVAF